MSSLKVLISRNEEQTLAERKKKIVTETIDEKVQNQENLSNRNRRFQVGDFLSGYLENQY